jgi:hypothetical protein
VAFTAAETAARQLLVLGAEQKENRYVLPWSEPKRSWISRIQELLLPLDDE